MDEGVDSGDMLSQVKVSIDTTDDASSLYSRISEIALEQIRDFLPDLIAGKILRKAQDPQIANTWRKRSIEDGRIDWRMSAESIHNLVRGLTRPYIGAHFDYMGQSIKVWKVTVEVDVPPNFEPGKVLSINEDGLLIKAGLGAIRLIDYQPKVDLKIGNYI